MKEAELEKIITNFTRGLLKKAKCKHAGNCYAVCQILKPYLSCLFKVETLINNCVVIQGEKKINHYYLLRVRDGIIIDPTSSQFLNPDGKRMPKTFIGKKPDWYQ